MRLDLSSNAIDDSTRMKRTILSLVAGFLLIGFVDIFFLSTNKVSAGYVADKSFHPYSEGNQHQVTIVYDENKSTTLQAVDVITYSRIYPHQKCSVSYSESLLFGYKIAYSVSFKNNENQSSILKNKSNGI